MASRGTNHRGGRPSHTPDPSGKILSVTDVAVVVGFRPQAISNWMRRGYKGTVVPPYDHAGGCVWLRETIVPWLESHGFTVPPTVRP